MSLTAEQLQAFANDGFLIYGAFFATDEIAVLREHVEKIVSRPANASKGKGLLTDRAGSIRQIMNASQYDPFFESWMTDERLLNVAESILGGSFHAWDEVIYKPAKAGRDTPWHQDNEYYILDPPKAISCWIPLTEVTAENGTMRFIAESHRWGGLEHGAGQEVFDRELAEPEDVRSVPVELPAGGLSIHSVLTVHGATPNRSDTGRPVYIARYVSDECRSLAGEERQRDLEANPLVRRDPSLRDQRPSRGG